LEKNKKHTHDLELEALSAVVVKKFLSEVSIHFPGVPLRRLYKQYKGKQDKAHTETIATAQESRNVEKQTKKKHKNCSTNDEKESVQEEPSLKRRRSKRKISTQSDDELSEKQLKKVRRRKEREKKMSDDKKEDVAETSVSERLRKKRSREEEDIQHVEKGKRKSARLGKHGEGANEKQGKNEEKEAKPESSKRKKRKTMEDELDTHSKGELVKSEDSRTSNDDRKAVDKNDLLWTERYQPECSSEVMGNASAVSRLKSWLEAWKIKREKTLRKELELQKPGCENSIASAVKTKLRNGTSNEIYFKNWLPILSFILCVFCWIKTFEKLIIIPATPPNISKFSDYPDTFVKGTGQTCL